MTDAVNFERQHRQGFFEANNFLNLEEEEEEEEATPKMRPPTDGRPRQWDKIESPQERQ